MFCHVQQIVLCSFESNYYLPCTDKIIISIGYSSVMVVSVRLSNMSFLAIRSKRRVVCKIKNFDYF